MNRLSPKKRKAEILKAALTVARVQGFEKLTQENIATEAGCHHSLVNHYLGKMKDVRHRIMRAAVKDEILEVIAYGIYTRHPQALKAPEELKMRAIASMTGAFSE